MEWLTYLSELGYELIRWVVLGLLIWSLWIGLSMALKSWPRITDSTSLQFVLTILTNKLLGCLYVGFALVGLVLYLGLIR